MYDVYQAPQSGDEPEHGGELSLLSEPNRCRAATGWAWIPQAFSIFRERWGKWLLIGLLALLCTIPFSMAEQFLPPEIAWVASVLSFMLGIFLMCGIVYGAASQVENGELESGSLFAGFQLKFKQVLILSVLQLLVMIGLLLLAMIPIVLLLGFGLDAMSLATFGQNLGKFMVAFILLFLILFVGLAITTWFTPALVILHDIPPARAIAMSVRGGLANLPPLLVYALALIGFAFAVGLLFSLLAQLLPPLLFFTLAVLLAIPAALCFTVWNGLVCYVSYLSVWTDAELES